MQKRIALTIGIGNYTYHDPLIYCPDSAEAVFNLLIDPRFGKCSHPPESRLITVRDKETLSRTDLDKIITETISMVNEGDQFVFYYCGHGYFHDGDYFLLLPETQSTTSENFAFTAYDFDFLTKALKYKGVNKAILIIDACYSAAMFSPLTNLMTSMGGELPTLWHPQKLPHGIVGIASTGDWNEAWESSELKSTLFSHYFCEGVRSWKNPRSPYITPQEIRSYINEQIKNNFPKEIQRVRISSREHDADIWVSYNPSYHPRAVVDANDQLEILDSEMKKRGIFIQTVEYWLQDNQINCSKQEQTDLIYSLTIQNIEILRDKSKEILQSNLNPIVSPTFRVVLNELNRNNVEKSISPLQHALERKPFDVPVALLLANLLCFNREFKKALDIFWNLVNDFSIPHNLAPKTLISKVPDRFLKQVRPFTIEIPLQDKISQVVCSPEFLAINFGNAINVYSWSGTLLFTKSLENKQFKIHTLNKNHLLLRYDQDVEYSIYNIRTENHNQLTFTDSELGVLFNFPNRAIENVVWSAEYTTPPPDNVTWFDRTFLRSKNEEKTEFSYYYSHLKLKIEQIYRLDISWRSRSHIKSYQSYRGQGIYVPKEKVVSETYRERKVNRYIRISPQ